jgi:hypothetical protein
LNKHREKSEVVLHGYYYYYYYYYESKEAHETDTGKGKGKGNGEDRGIGKVYRRTGHESQKRE